MKMKFTKMSMAIGCALVTASCATGPDGRPQGPGQSSLKETFASDDPCSNNARNIGIVGGAILGAVIAKKTGNGKGSVAMGAGLGALVGGVIGADMDRRRCELAKVAKLHNLDIAMTDIKMQPTSPAYAQPSLGQPAPNPYRPAPQPATDQKPQTVGMSFTVFDHGDQFATGSAYPSPSAQQAFADVAGKYVAIADGTEPGAAQKAQERNRRMRILLIGHTDDTGSSRLNADLSEERAKAVARIFAQRGFDPGQIYYQGAGEVYPIADNNTEEGRARNRRVEIVDLSDDATFQAFLASRRPNVANYRAVADEPAPGQSSAQSATRPSTSNQVSPTAPATGTTASIAQAPPTPTIAPGKQQPVGDRPAQAPVKAAAVNSAVTAQALDGFDFGGKPIDGQLQSVNIGKPLHTTHFSLISTAYASDDAMPIGNCAKDRPRISNQVKSLSSGQEVRTADYMPGAAKTSWGGKANGHMVGLADVAVLRDGGQPSSRPTLFVWKNWVDGSKARPDLKTSADANTYLGDQAMLYRVFPDSGPVRCIDVRIPNGAPNTAPSSTIVYQRVNALYQAEYSPSIAR